MRIFITKQQTGNIKDQTYQNIQINIQLQKTLPKEKNNLNKPQTHQRKKTILTSTPCKLIYNFHI